MQTEGLDFKGALESLADRFGVKLETEEEAPEAAAARARRERLYCAADARRDLLLALPVGVARRRAAAREYLLGRGFTEEMLREFRVGYAPDSLGPDHRGRRARRASPTTSCVAAGLDHRVAQRPGQLVRLLPRARSCSRPPTPAVACAASADAQLGTGGGPKYVNTPEGELYHKREVLYGIELARAAAAKAGRMVLVEGYTDVIAMHQAGIRNAVGIMGTSLTKEQVAELVRVVGVLELCLDADGAGQEAMVRAARLCADSQLELRVVSLPPGADPADLIASEGVLALRDRVATSVPYVVFAVDRILANATLGSSEGKDRAIAALRPVLGALGQSVLRDELVRRAAAALELTDGRFLTLLAPEGRPRRAPVAPAPVPAPAPVLNGFEQAVRAERAFLAMCVAAPTVGRPALAAIDPDELLSSDLMRRAARHLGANLDAPLAELPRDDDELSRAVADLVSRAGRGGAVTSDQLEHSRLLLELARLDRQLNRARGERRPGVAALAQERQTIRTQLEAVGSRLQQSL